MGRLVIGHVGQLVGGAGRVPQEAIDAAIRDLSSRWLGKGGVVGVHDDYWREGPVLVVTTLTGEAPRGLPRRFEGMRVVVVEGRAAVPQGVGWVDEVGFAGAGEVPIDPRYAGLSTDDDEAGSTGVLPGRPTGRMRVQFGIHGGRKGFLDVVDGMVDRCARSIREGYPRTQAAPSRVRFAEDHVWRDIPTALTDGVGGAGTWAVWRAAEIRAAGDGSAKVALVSGIPMVIRVDGQGRPISGSIEDPTPGRVITRGLVHPKVETAGMSDDEGITRDWAVFTIDDDYALPVREVNDAVARHNAQRIAAKGLPPLYESGVQYKVEGSPELWWDYEEQLRTGHDDCEGLAATRAGELMLQGYDAKVHTRAIQKPAQFAGGKAGGRLFHAITRVDGKWDPETGAYTRILAPDGTPVYDDPSASIGYRGYWLRKSGGRGEPSASMPVPPWYAQYAARRRAEGKDL